MLSNLPQRLYYGCFLAFLAILPIANTIALRNLLLLCLLGLLAFSVVWQRERLAQPVGALLSRAYWPVLSWIIFLCLFPLWAEQPDVAWANLREQWGLSIATWLVGLGAVWLLGERGPSLWALAVASAFLAGLHLVLSLMAWAGLFGGQVSSGLPVEAMWAALKSTFDASSGLPWRWQSFPWGFRGFDPMHGNLGYTATQAVALFAVCLLLGWRRQKLRWILGGAFGIVLCFLSVVVANSRGAVLFSLMVLLVAVAVFFFRLRQAVPSGRGQTSPRLLNYKVVLLFLLLAVALILVQSIRKDARWHAMVDKVRAAFMVEDPVGFLCNGVSPSVTEKIQARFATRDSQYVQQLIEGLGGDGGRILLMRAGFELMLHQPLGLDGSRHTYKKLIEERCGHPPAMEFAHAHQGWIDTALALGWGGGLLLACLMLYFVWAGWRGVAHEAGWPWAFALLLLASFWFLRGFADSVYREHYLQMQALLLGYLFGRMTLANRQAL